MKPPESLSLRDWFASQVCSNVGAASASAYDKQGRFIQTGVFDWKRWAEVVYEAADALVAESRKAK